MDCLQWISGSIDRTIGTLDADWLDTELCELSTVFNRQLARARNNRRAYGYKPRDDPAFIILCGQRAYKRSYGASIGVSVK
jgi:hypothetical protein